MTPGNGPDVRAIDAGKVNETPFPSARQEFRVRIAEQAFDTITARGQENLTREIGGVLVGRLGRDAAGPYVVVETTIDALHAEEKGTELTFTHATWDHIHKEMDGKHHGKTIVGWYHTHPGFGIFLSDRDQFIHRSFFSLPFQVALVYDPKSREHGVFAWRDGEPLRWRRYWIGEAEHLWDAARAPKSDPRAMAAAGSVPETGGPMAATPSTASEDEPPLDRKSLAIFAVMILALGGILGSMIGRCGSSGGDAPVEGERGRARGEAQIDPSGLNTRLLYALRELMTDAPVRKGLDDAAKSLDEAMKAIDDAAKAPGDAKGAVPPDAIQKLERARAGLLSLRQKHNVAMTALAELEDVSAQLQGANARQLGDSMRRMSLVLGAICEERAVAAAKAGNVNDAKRWLLLAEPIDPGNAEARVKHVQEALAPGGGK